MNPCVIPTISNNGDNEWINQVRMYNAVNII